MKKPVIVLISVLFCLSANAQMKWNSKYQSYIDQYKDLAIEEIACEYHACSGHP